MQCDQTLSFVPWLVKSMAGETKSIFGPLSAQFFLVVVSLTNSEYHKQKELLIAKSVLCLFEAQIFMLLNYLDLFPKPQECYEYSYRGMNMTTMVFIAAQLNRSTSHTAMTWLKNVSVLCTEDITASRIKWKPEQWNCFALSQILNIVGVGGGRGKKARHRDLSNSVVGRDANTLFPFTKWVESCSCYSKLATILRGKSTRISLIAPETFGDLNDNH